MGCRSTLHHPAVQAQHPWSFCLSCVLAYLLQSTTRLVHSRLSLRPRTLVAAMIIEVSLPLQSQHQLAWSCIVPILSSLPDGADVRHTELRLISSLSRLPLSIC